MLPDRVSNPGLLTYESGALPIVLRAPAKLTIIRVYHYFIIKEHAGFKMVIRTDIGQQSFTL